MVDVYDKTWSPWKEKKGTRVVASESMWQQPLKWNAEAGKAVAAWAASHRGKMACDEQPPERPRVFCASLADVFEDWDGPMLTSSGESIIRSRDGKPLGQEVNGMFFPEYASMNDVRRRLFDLIDATPNLDWLLVTKRPENIRRMWPQPINAHDYGSWEQIARARRLREIDSENWHRLDKAGFRPNVWLLTSVSDQATADEFHSHIADCCGLVDVLGFSAEPLLGPIVMPKEAWQKMQWCIVGSESGHNRRPMQEAWAQSLADQCRDAGVKFFMKQMEIGGQVTGDIERFPVSLRVREYPNTKAIVTA